MEENTSIMAIINNMKVGEKVSFTFARANYSTLRHYACTLGLANNRKYTCHIHREARHYVVTRVS